MLALLVLNLILGVLGSPRRYCFVRRFCMPGKISNDNFYSKERKSHQLGLRVQKVRREMKIENEGNKKKENEK